MQASAKNNEKCVEKLNQMKKYLPFIDFMINKIKKKIDTLPLESQLVKFQHLRSMISERNEKHNWNVIVRVEDVIEQLVVKLNYKDQNHKVGEESTGFLGGETEGNNTRVRGVSTSMNNEVNVTSPIRNSSSSTATSIVTVDGSNSQNIKTMNKVDALRNSSDNCRDDDVQVIPINDLSNSGLNKTWSLIPIEDSRKECLVRRIMETNLDKDLDGHNATRSSKSNRNTVYSVSPGVSEEVTPHTDSLSSNRGTLTQSYPSTSQETFSQSHKSHSSSNNRNQGSRSSCHKSGSEKNPKYRRDYSDRVTMYDCVKTPQVCDRGGEKRDGKGKHSKEYVNTLKDPRLDRMISQSESSLSRLPDFSLRARQSERSSSDSYKNHGSGKDLAEPKKDSSSKQKEDLEVVEVISHRRSKSTGNSEGEKSHMRLTSEKDRRHSTNSGGKEDLFGNNTRKKKADDKNPGDEGNGKKTHISSLDDVELEKFVKENYQALPHLSTLKPSEIREAIRSLGIETFEEPSNSPNEPDLQDLDEFMNSTQAPLENSSSEILVVEDSDPEAQNKSTEHEIEQEDNVKNTNPVVEESENVIALEKDDNSPKVTEEGNDLNKDDSTTGTTDELNPNIQPPVKKGLLELPLPKMNEPHDGTSQMEPDRLTMPSEESNVNRGDHVAPFTNVKNPTPVIRRHSLHLAPVQSMPTYRTKEVVYDKWLASVPSPMIPLPGCNPMIRPNTLLDPRLAMATSSQSYHGMLIPMGNINVCQMMGTPGFQHPILFSPLINPMPGQDGKISNPSHPSEAKSYAEYKRLKNEEMRKSHSVIPLPQVSPNTSSESSVSGGPTGEESEPKKTQFFRNPPYRRRGKNNSCRGGRAMINRTQRRYSNYDDNRPRYRGNSNERPWKDEERRKKTDSEKTVSSDSEETISPLDSLYRSEPKLQTGRGYGLQHFKIPKKVRSDTSGEGNTKFHTENKRNNSIVEEDWDRPDDSTNTNKDDKDLSSKGEENRDSPEETANKSRNDTDVSPREEESLDSPEQATNQSRNDKDGSPKGEENRDSPEQATNKSRNDKDVRPKGEENKTSSGKTTNKNNKKGTTRKGRENRDSLQQTTNKTQSDRNVSGRSRTNRDIPEKTRNSSKGGRIGKKNVEKDVNSGDETVNKENVSNVEGKSVSRDATPNATEGSSKDQSDGNFLNRETTANTEKTADGNMESREMTENTREDNNSTDQLDENLPSRETTTNTSNTKRNRNTKSKKVSIKGGKSKSCEETANATEGSNTNQSDGNSLCCEAAPNTQKTRNMESDGMTENRREGNNSTDQSDGNPPSRETTTDTSNTKKNRNTKSRKVSVKGEKSKSCEETANATKGNNTDQSDGNPLSRNTEEDDRKEVSNKKRDGLRVGSGTNDNEKNENGTEGPAARLELEDWYDEEHIEREESSNAGSNEGEANKLRESLVAECDSSMSTPFLEQSKSMQNNQEDTSKSSVAPKESVTSEWVETLVRRHAGPKSEKIVHVLEKISQLSEEKLQTIEKIINSENVSSEVEDGEKQQRSRGSEGGSDQSTKEEQKSPSHESLKNENQGEAAEKEMEANGETEKSDLSASNTNQIESEQVTNAKRSRKPRTRRRRVGMDFVTRKKNKKTPQQQTEKTLLTQSEGTDAGSLNSKKAQKPKTNKKPKARTKTELDRLHDDIRSMFIGPEVIAATGPRSCRMMKTVANNTNNSDNGSENATPSEGQSRRVSAQRNSRSAGRRNTNSTDVIPSGSVIHETHVSPLVEEYHKSIKWPRIVMQKVDLDNFRYGQKITETCIKFRRQKGSNKAIRSVKQWKSQLNASLIKNEDVLRKIINKKTKKNSTNRSSKGKKKTEREISPSEMDQMEYPEAWKKLVTEEPQAMSQRNMSLVRFSEGKKEKIDEYLDDDSLLNYSLERKEMVYRCKLCPVVTRDISAHYKTDHPESEVLISRLSATEVADAIREAAENDFEDTSLEDTPLDRVRNILLARPRASSHYYCRMCNEPAKTSIFSFYVHVTQHTGEYRYRCPSRVCGVTEPHQSSIKNHVWDIHHKHRFRLYWNEVRLYSMPAELGYLYGFICSKCNFVQIFRENLEKHVARQHGGDKNIEIIKINLSSKNPPEVTEEKRDLQGVRIRVEPTEQGNLNEDNMENTGHEEADKLHENRKRPVKRKRTLNPRSGEFTGSMDDGDNDEEVESKRLFLDAQLETEIEVHDSDSYLLKPEADLETVSETNLESNLEMHLEPSSESNLKTQFKGNSEPNLEAKLEANLESDLVEVDECPDLRKFTSIRGSDIIDPLESSDSRDTDSGDNNSGDTDSRDTDSPFATVESTPRDRITDTFKVGPLQAYLADNYEIFYECFIKGCLFNTKSYVTFEKHLKISHASTKWKGNCRVCRGNVKDKRLKRWPTVSFALTSALKHLKIHAKQKLCQRLGKVVNSSTQDGCISRVETDDTLYPRTPLLRVRSFLGDRLSTPRDPLEITTQEGSVGSIAREEPTATCYTEESTNDSLMFTIQDVRSLNTEVGNGSGIQYDEVPPVKSVRESSKVVTGQPVIVRSCPTRQIAIRPETSVLPIEVGHLQVVQAPVTNSSVVLNPVTDSTSVTNEVILGTLPDSVPVRIRSSIPTQPQTPRFALQPVMISTPASLRPPTQIVCPISTPTTSSQAVVPSNIVMEPESVAGTSSSDSSATVEQPGAQSVGMPGTKRVPRRWSVVKVDKGPTLPPSQPGEVAEEDSSLLMRSVLPFGNKTVKITDIYEEMLTKEKLCHLFKCMASDCSFTCKNRTKFDQHIKSHETEKKGKTAMFSKKGKKMYSWQQCSYCCEVVVNPSSELSQHVLNVHGHCTYQCGYCFFRAVSLNYVTIHQNLAHKKRAQDPSPVIYKCKKLSSGPTMPAGLEMQAKKQCVRPYHCDQCGNKFLIIQEFMDHLVREHQSVTAYSCHICKYLCFKADWLIAHYKLHSYSTYQCSYCLHGTEAEWEMVLHLCNFHFTQPAIVYMRAWAEETDVQREQRSLNPRNKKKNENQLECLKVLTYDEVLTPDCIIEQESDDEDDGNLMINESQDLNAIVAELGIMTEGESSDSVPIMQELASIANSSQDVPVTALLPNARFSSEGENGSETVLLSSGLSTLRGRENSDPEPVENSTSVPRPGMPLETVNYQTPAVSQPVLLPRFDVSFNTVSHSSRTVVEDKERSRATTSSSNLLKESATITSNVNPIPPATHRLPPVVLTTKPKLMGVLQREPLTASVVRTRQAEAEPAASSFENINEAEVSCDQQRGVVDPFQRESNINVEPNLFVTSEACFLPSHEQGLEDENNTEERKVMESSTNENSREETQNSTHDVSNENSDDNETEESNLESTSDKTTSNSKLPNERTINALNERFESETEVDVDVETITGEEEPSTSDPSPTTLPRTRFSVLRGTGNNDKSAPTRKNGGKSKKNSVHDLTGEKLYICGNRGCYFDAPNERQLENHLIVCDDSRNFPLLECPHCSKLFKQNVYYLEHLKCHGVKKLSCGLCSYKAAIKNSMIRHVKQKHRCKQFKTLPTEPPKDGYFVYYPKNYKKEKQDFKASGYSPGDEDKLPRQSVYLVNVKCAKCPYFTKVRSNMVRHLKIHVKSAETEGLVVPSTAPTNPVPCLDSKEKMFDKMTNLAASSQLAQAKEKSATETLTPEEIAKLPQFIDEHMRYKCCLSDCNYITVDDGMLKHHIKALHTEVTYYSCPHCKSTVHTDVRHVALEKIGFHLRHHDSKLYKCAHCIYFHYQKPVVEKHTIDKHPDRRYFIHTVREPKVGTTAEEESESSTTVWKCALCNDFQSPIKSGTLDHLSKSHGTKSLYKCLLCDMKSNHIQSFTTHFASKHPGENISYFPTILKDSITSPESSAIPESTNDHFDTTPLWQRHASRIRHIRGILIEEEEEEEVTRKKSKKTAEHAEGTSTPTPSPARSSTSSRTASPAPVRTTSPALARTSASSRNASPAPVRTTSPGLGRTSASAPGRTTSPALSRTSASAPARTTSPALSRTSTSSRTASPAPVRTTSPALARTSASAPARTTSPALAQTLTPATARTTTPVPAPAPTPAPARTHTLTPAPVQTSVLVAAPSRTQASTPASVRTRTWAPPPARTTKNPEEELFEDRRDFKEHHTRSRRDKEQGLLPCEENDMVFWVNSIIEQQRVEIERKRQLSEEEGGGGGGGGGGSKESQEPPKKKKKKSG